MDISWLEQNEADVPIGNQWLSTRERNYLSNMRFAKRRTDWRLGRWTAKHVVAACLNLPTDICAFTDIEVLAAPSGAPEVFLQNRSADIAISLSHRDGTALCMATAAGTSFGCDLEIIEPHTQAFIADYCTAEEQALIARTPMVRRALLVCLIWSAKESALKALHLGLRVDTRCVCVRAADSWTGPDGNEWQEFCTEHLPSNSDGWRPLSVQCSSGPLYGGWWRFQDQFVRTTVCDRPLRIPEQLQQSGLAGNRFPG
jgi:4'-phosphopantetheinyl transferase